MKKKIQGILTRFNIRRKKLNKVSINEKIDGVTYRLAEVSDIYHLLAIERDVYEGDTPWTHSHFRFEIEENPNAIFLLAEKNNQILGFIGTRVSFKYNTMHITNLAVKKEFQRRGLASVFITEMENLANIMTLDKLSLEVRRDNGEAQALYRKRGFISDKIMANYYDDGSDGILMTKILIDSDYNG